MGQPREVLDSPPRLLLGADVSVRTDSRVATVTNYVHLPSCLSLPYTMNS